jgi:uncharacterized protein YecE (DUF72 family)
LNYQGKTLYVKQKAYFRIGTSNVTLPGNKGTFPLAFQSKSRLHYYSRIFNSVEINKCFYKTPLLSTYQKWSLDVPENFQFSLKLSKAITHVPNLPGDSGTLTKFMQTAAGVGNKKGCLLIQFPGAISLDYYNEVEQILQEIQFESEPDQHWRIAVEFRNPDWYTGETFELLDQYDAVAVLHDFKKGKLTEISGREDFVYIRFHGPAGDYRGSYNESFLKSKAAQIRIWLEDGKDVYAYFNNTMGNAFDNAISLKDMILV